MGISFYKSKPEWAIIFLNFTFLHRLRKPVITNIYI